MTTAPEVALVLVFFVAAVVNGVAGLGFALVASAFTAVIVDPRLAVLLLGAVTPIANVQQLFCSLYSSGASRSGMSRPN